MPLEIKDLLGLDKPMTKLIEVIGSGIGTVYRPRAMRKEADAKAYEIVALSKAAAEGEKARQEIELVSNMGRIEAIAHGDPELAQRAKQRLLIREIEGQVNIEAISEFATLALPSSVSEVPVSADWRRKFFLEAENVCDEDIQKLWGKVLAGEVANPGSFSIRALDTLRNISQSEAELFRQFCSIAMSDGWIVNPGDVNTAFLPFGISYSSIMTLRDIGILANGENLHRKYSAPPGVDAVNHSIVVSNNGIHIRLSGGFLGTSQIPSMFFSNVGKELQRLIEPSVNEAYLTAIGDYFRGIGSAAKRGRPVPQEDGISIIIFEDDL